MIFSRAKASRVAVLAKRVAAHSQGESVRARFMNGAFWSLAGAVASRAPTLLGSIVAARMLGITSFGELGIVQNTVLLFGTFAGLGLGLTATKYVAEYRASAPDRAGRHIGLSLIATLAASFVMALPFILLAPWLATHLLGAPSLALDLQIAAGLLFFSALNGTQNGILAGFEAFRMVAQVNVVRAVLSLALLTMGVMLGGVFGGVLGLVGAEAAGSFIGYLAIKRETRRAGIRTQYRNLGGEMPVLWTFSLPALLSSMATLPAIWAANLLLVRQPDGYAAMGLFTAANKWSLLILFIPTSVANIVLPMLANLRGAGDDQAFRRVFHANVLVGLGCTLVPGALIAAFAVPIMALYGGDYRMGWPILAILALATVPTALNTILGQAIVSTDSIWWRFWFDVLLAAILFGCAWLLIPRWGATGMAVAYALAFTVTSLGLFLFIQRHFWSRRNARPFSTISGVHAMLDRPAFMNAAVAPRSGGPLSRPAPLRGPAHHATRPASWSALAGYLAILAFLAVPNEHRFPAVIVSASAFGFMQLLFPRCRPVIETPICPLNWALLVFFLQLIVLPLMITFLGPSTGTLPFLPSDFATNVSLILSTLGYVAFCAAYQLFTAHSASRPSRPGGAVGWTPSGEIIFLYAAIGIIGMILDFGSIHNILTYFVPPGDVVNPESATLRSAAPHFLKPFIGVAFVMIWCRWVDRHGRASTRVSRLLVTAGTALPVILVYATFGFNRGSFAVPLVSMAAVYLARVRRVPIKVMAGITLAAILVLVSTSLSRGDTVAGTNGASGQPTQPASRFVHAAQFDLNDQVQVYGAAPQFGGFLLERTDYARDPYWGSTLLSSALFPTPILGKPFRPGSGVVIYNELIYGPVGNLDQNLPIEGELFINFRVVGVIAGFFLLGYVASRLQRAFAQALTAVEAYFSIYTSIWTFFMIVGSLAATSQVFIYFCWPIYGYFILKALHRTARPDTRGERQVRLYSAH